MLCNNRFRVALSVTMLALLAIVVAVACAPAPAPTPTSAPVAALPTATAAPAKPTEDPALKGLTDAQKKWAQNAQVGPYAPKTQDWAAIETAAKKEGTVVVYSASSRVADYGKTFEAAYPGIKVEGYDIAAMEVVTKLRQEQQSGVYTADVIFSGDAPTYYNEMVNPPTKYLWNFVPQELEAVIDPEFRNPLLIHHFSLSVWIYNNQVYKEPPIKNIWDITKPEWKGRIVLADPQKSAGNLNTLAAYTQNPEAMAKAYETAFGKPIKLDAGVPDAAYQWIKDLIKNEPVLTSSSGDAAKAAGTKGQKTPPIAMTSYSKIRDVIKGDLSFDVMWGMQPVIGAYDDFIVAIANQAPHPNAAKLMVRWVMGDEKGGKGYAPYFVPGDPSPRKDMADPKGATPWAQLQKLMWRTDNTYVYNNAIKVRDFWIANLKK